MPFHESRLKFILYSRTFLVPAVSVLLIAGMLYMNSNNSGSTAKSSIRLLQARVSRLKSMFEQAEAIRAVKRLQCAYGQYAEFGLWDDLADLFASNGIGHYPAGDLKKEDIRRLFRHDIGGGKLGLPEGLLYPHIMLQPVITLAPDGKSARGRWRVFTMLGFHEKNANWAGGVYENEYVFENGVWKIRDLHFYLQYSGSYEQTGWTIARGEIPMHYTPDLAGDPVSKSTEPTYPVTRPDERELMHILRDFKRRAQRLIDQQEVENLQHIYGYYVDRKMWDDVADLFLGDGTMELGLQGVYKGRKSIRHALEQFGPQGLREGELNDHLQLQTLVDVSSDGLSANTRGSELIMSGKYGGSGEWGLGVFENEFVKKDGVWHIQSMHIYPIMRADYDKGWAKGAKPDPEINNEFPPDKPSPVKYKLFPKFYIPGFHYNNPVTGLPPQYPERVILAGGFSGSKAEVSSGADPDGGESSINDMEKMAEEVERMIRRSTGYDSCENITSAYGYYIDEFKWDETADLYAPDGWRELPFVGIYQGRERIRKSMKLRYPGTGGRASGFFTCHQIIQPVIHVSEDGRSADIRARLFQLAGADGTNGMWMAGIYEKKAVIINGVWKFSAMDLDYTWTADYKGGWTAGGMSLELSPGTINETFPPDRPLRGVAKAPFPKISDVPFHYVNPVTGRQPVQ